MCALRLRQRRRHCWSIERTRSYLGHSREFTVPEAKKGVKQPLQ